MIRNIKIYITYIFIFIFFSCSIFTAHGRAYSKAEKAQKQGDYYQAVLECIKSLESKPKYEKPLLLLDDVFPKTVKTYNQKIDRFLKNEDKNWDFIIKSYKEIIHMINSIKKLNYIKKNKKYIEIGATTPLIEFESEIIKHYPDFKDILERYGSVQIRNVATIAGNIATASPIGDTLPLLLALNAKIVISNSKNDRILYLKDFFINYRKTKLKNGQFIKLIKIPLLQNNIFKAYKISKRIDDDISAVCASFNLNIKNNIIVSISIAYGGMAAIPKKALQCEKSLLNKDSFFVHTPTTLEFRYIILSKIYILTIMHWINNKSLDETVNFLDKQLKNVSKIPLVKDKIRNTFFGGWSNNKKSFISAILILLVIWIFSGLYKVNANFTEPFGGFFSIFCLGI